MGEKGNWSSLIWLVMDLLSPAWLPSIATLTTFCHGIMNMTG